MGIVPLPLDRSSGETLSRQVYYQIRDKILRGDLPGGFRLPATRDFAESLKVSRNVILGAYDQLYAEGYVYSRRGAGTYVSPGAVLQREEERRHPASRGLSLPAMTLSGVDAERIDFRSGLPDLDQFPRRVWQRLSRDVLENSSFGDLAYGHPEGHPDLRESIAGYLRSSRGISCRPEDILITAGTTQAIGILTRLLCPRGDGGKDVLLEDPLTGDIKRIIQINGGFCHPIPIDEEGLDAGKIDPALSPRFVYITPSHQFPLGSTMSAPRRIALLEYARLKGAFVVEDDYDSEFRFDVGPVQSLYELDRERVIYCGTFSKTVFPSLRIAYLILPPGLFLKGRELKWYTDLHNPTIDQLILSRFIRDGHFIRHVGRMRKQYQNRRALFISSLTGLFGDDVSILGCEAGLHLCARFRQRNFHPVFLEEMKKKGLLLYPVADHSLFPEAYRDTLIFGYARLSPPDMYKGLCLLKEHLQGEGRSSYSK